MKKFISLSLCIAFCTGMITVPVQAEPRGKDSADIKYASGNVLYYEDFEGENPEIAKSDVCEIQEEADGNKYMDIYTDDRPNNGQYDGSNTIYFDSLPADFVITLDICRASDDDVEFWIEYYSDSFGTTNSNGQNVAKFVKRININSWYWKRDTWYRLEYVKYPDNSVKATMVERDTGTPLTVQSNWYTETTTASTATSYNRFLIRTDLYNDTVKYHWLVDNISLTELGAECKNETFVRSARFVDESGKTVTTIPHGSATAKFQVENNGGLDSAVAILAAFDENNRLLKLTEKEISLSSGESVVSAEIELSDIYSELKGGRVEGYLWDSTDGMNPLGKTYAAIGRVDTTESSETDAQIGSEGAGGAYGFSALDRSMEAGKLTLEGVHSLGENELVLVKAEGKNSGKLLFASQIRTRADGSFKESFIIDSQMSDEDYEAVITVSAENTATRTFEIPVATGWAELPAEFEAADDAEKLKDFFVKYAANLRLCVSGEEGIKDVDCSAFVPEDFENMSFAKEYSDFGKMTASETVAAALILIEKNQDVKEFMALFADIRELTTVDEKTVAIKELVEGCSFIQFPTEGVFNTEKIYARMAESDAENIRDFYSDYVAAVEEQKQKESNLVEGFVAIGSGTAMKQYFADNSQEMGISPDMFSEKLHKISIPKIKPGETREIEFNFPEIIRKEAYNLNGIINLNGDYKRNMSNRIDFAVATYAKNKPVIDGVVNEDEWNLNTSMDMMYADQAVNLDGFKWGGVEDLSGRVCIEYDEDNFYFAAIMKDDIFCQPHNDNFIWKGDGIQFGTAYSRVNGNELSTAFSELSFALTSEGEKVYLTVGEDVTFKTGEMNQQELGIECKIKREGNITSYELKLPKRAFTPLDTVFENGRNIAFSMLVNDNDGLGRKGWLEYASGIGKNKNVTLFTFLKMIEM